MAYNQNKTEHAFQTFHKDLKTDDFSSVLFLYGEEEYLIQWAAESLVNKYVDKSMKDFDFVKFQDEDVSIEMITEACNTFSMLSPKRVVWAHNFQPLLKKNAKGFGEKELSVIQNYIVSPNPDTLLIFSCIKPEDGAPLVKLLKSASRCYAFDRLDMAQLVGFADKRFKAAGVNIDRSTLRYFIDETGYFNKEGDYRILNLVNDIKKLIAHSGGLAITRDDVDQTLQGDLDRFAFSFLDAIGANRKDTALRLLHNMLGAGGDVYSLLGLLVNQFELMLEAKELKSTDLNQEEIAKTLRINPYRVKKALAVADKFSDKKLKEILTQLYQIDRNIKTGQMEQTLALELLIGRI